MGCGWGWELYGRGLFCSGAEIETKGVPVSAMRLQEDKLVVRNVHDLLRAAMCGLQHEVAGSLLRSCGVHQGVILSV